MDARQPAPPQRADDVLAHAWRPLLAWTTSGSFFLIAGGIAIRRAQGVFQQPLPSAAAALILLAGLLFVALARWLGTCLPGWQRSAQGTLLSLGVLCGLAVLTFPNPSGPSDLLIGLAAGIELGFSVARFRATTSAGNITNSESAVAAPAALVESLPENLSQEASPEIAEEDLEPAESAEVEGPNTNVERFATASQTRFGERGVVSNPPRGQICEALESGVDQASETLSTDNRELSPRLDLGGLSSPARQDPYSIQKPPALTAANQTAWQAREVGDDGTEQVVGWSQVVFAPGQRLARVHLAFCPPFARSPICEAETTDGPAANVQVGQLLPHGARLEVRLDEAPAERTILRIDYAARVPNSESERAAPRPAA